MSGLDGIGLDGVTGIFPWRLADPKVSSTDLNGINFRASAARKAWNEVTKGGGTYYNSHKNLSRFEMNPDGRLR